MARTDIYKLTKLVKRNKLQTTGIGAAAASTVIFTVPVNQVFVLKKAYSDGTGSGITYSKLVLRPAGESAWIVLKAQAAAAVIEYEPQSEMELFEGDSILADVDAYTSAGQFYLLLQRLF